MCCLCQLMVCNLKKLDLRTCALYSIGCCVVAAWFQCNAIRILDIQGSLPVLNCFVDSCGYY